MMMLYFLTLPQHIYKFVYTHNYNCIRRQLIHKLRQQSRVAHQRENAKKQEVLVKEAWVNGEADNRQTDRAAHYQSQQVSIAPLHIQYISMGGNQIT
jgi:hypothetical protein